MTDRPDQPGRGRVAGAVEGCWRCNLDGHVCPGCGIGVPHGTVACPICKAIEPDAHSDEIASAG